MPILHAVSDAEAMATINWPTTGHEPQATGCFSAIPRTRPPLAAEIRGPCRTSRQDSVAVVPFATS